MVVALQFALRPFVEGAYCQHGDSDYTLILCVNFCDSSFSIYGLHRATIFSLSCIFQNYSRLGCICSLILNSLLLAYLTARLLRVDPKGGLTIAETALGANEGAP